MVWYMVIHDKAVHCEGQGNRWCRWPCHGHSVSLVRAPFLPAQGVRRSPSSCWGLWLCTTLTGLSLMFSTWMRWVGPGRQEEGCHMLCKKQLYVFRPDSSPGSLMAKSPKGVGWDASWHKGMAEMVYLSTVGGAVACLAVALVSPGQIRSSARQALPC